MIIDKKGFITLSVLIIFSLLSSIIISLYRVSLDYHYFLKLQENHLIHYANALSGIRYAKYSFHDLPIIHQENPSFDEIMLGKEFMFNNCRFTVLRNDSHLFSISDTGDFVSALSCSYSIENDTLVFNNLQYYFEE